MKRFIALLILAAASLPAQADWRFEDGVAIATPDQRNTSNIDAVVISCADPYLFEVYADGGPVRPSSGGTETDYFYQPGKVRADVDGTFFPFVAAGSGEAVVLFAEGSAANDYLGTNDPAFIAALKHGREIDLVDIAANWYVDDLPPMMFMKKSPNSHGFVNPRDIEEMWRDQFDWVYREMDYAVFAFTIHPDVSGRPQVLLMLERLIEHMGGKPGVSFDTCHNIQRDFRARHPFETDSKYPFDRGIA